jgi:probable rRNA maturation factor
MVAEHVVDWRFEGIVDADLVEVEGPTLAANAGQLLGHLAETIAPGGESLELSLLLTDDAGIRPLNARWRDTDAATDVLSFPLEEGPMLGDVVISVETAARRRDGDRWRLEDELLFLLLHGVLHLLGHDHHVEEERQAMEAAEQRLWTALGRPGTLRDPVERN